ncbi:hypothetical protein B0H11DRAFT_2246491 [Mycena galericulata]|nr:hypothetical protein B0H11DRAFT_2246491 [Mycena galericulata]
MGIGSFISSLLPTTHADSEEKPADNANAKEDASSNEEGGEEEAPKEEEAEEEEPEDVRPRLLFLRRYRILTISHPSFPHPPHVHGTQSSTSSLARTLSVTTPRDANPPHSSEACAAPQVFAKLR